MADVIFWWIGASVAVTGGVCAGLFFSLTIIRLTYKHVNVVKNSWKMFLRLRREDARKEYERNI